MKKRILLLFVLTCFAALVSAQDMKEPYRPKFHFTPKANWMNDPNGMVFHNGTYHLFYQYYPDDKIWGPMHWGHATSKDLFTWKEQPIALYPDKLGYIFSGSAVVDVNNTSGFGKNGKTPMVAIYTSHDPVQEKQKTGRHETQSIAYSLDEGVTWTKYEKNPVLANPGIEDFRDPKVSWYAPKKRWIMTLATKDRVTFYSSPDLKKWSKESEFGADAGAHGGVWECPDLFPITHNGKQVWVLIVNINPGGPNGGSAGQYFLGDFDGKTFTAYSSETKWLDSGTDNYAAVTFSNTGNRRILLGWMSNWQYANQVPTHPWRSANTIPRELGLTAVGKELYLTSVPVRELDALAFGGKTVKNLNIKSSQTYDIPNGLFRLEFETAKREDWAVTLSNGAGGKLVLGYEKETDQYFIDRTAAGESGFEKGFAKKHVAPRLSTDAESKVTIVGDVASVELFADGGLAVMTDIFFPKPVMKKLTLSSPGIHLKELKLVSLKETMK